MGQGGRGQKKQWREKRKYRERGKKGDKKGQGEETKKVENEDRNGGMKK